MNGQNPYSAEAGSSDQEQTPYERVYAAPQLRVPSVSGNPDTSAESAASQAGASSMSAESGCDAPKRSKGWIVALVAVILFFLLMFFSLASCNAAIHALTSPLDSLSQSFSADSFSADTIGIIEISGTIQYDGSTCSPEGLKTQLDIAAENNDIAGVVLRVDSGGGTAAAGEEMACYLRRFREECGKPVVVSSASMNASAAYEISSQADYIFTAKSTSIGAIGTALQITDYSGLLDMLGITVENITSSDSKDSTYGTRSLSDEERAYYQAMIDQINESFIETVASGRNMDIEAVRALATGLTFTGIDAVENGLADEIGTLEDAIDKAVDLSGIAAADVVYLQPGSSGIADLFGLFGNTDISLEEILKELSDYGGIDR